MNKTIYSLILGCLLLQLSGCLTHKSNSPPQTGQEVGSNRAVSGNDAQAQYEFGLRYANGDGLESNPEQAAQFFLSAAKQGHAEAQAAHWYQQAASQGELEAQNLLGRKPAQDESTKLTLEQQAQLKNLNAESKKLYETGKYSEAEKVVKQALDILGKIFGDENLEYAENLNNLAQLHHAQGRYKEAEQLFLRSLNIKKKILGDLHPSVATSLNNLAQLYKDKGRLGEAESLFLLSFDTWKKTLGNAHPSVAISLNNLAQLYLDQGRYVEAQPLIMKSLELWKSTLGDTHPYVATSLLNLSLLYKYQGQYEKAENCIIKSLLIIEKIHGINHPSYATTIDNLASLYQDQGRFVEAERLYIKSLAIRKTILGENHPDLANSLNNLALLYKDQGRYAEEEPLLLKSFSIRKKVFGEQHPALANSLNNLALLYRTLGRFIEAEALFFQSLAISEKTLGKYHPHYATTLINLAGLYKDQGNYTKAETRYLQGLRIHLKVYGQASPEVAISINNLATMYYKQGRYEEAEPLIVQSMMIAENAFDQSHPFVAIGSNNLGMLFESQDKKSQAEVQFKKSLRIMNQVLEGWLWGADELTRQSYLQQQENNRNIYISFYGTNGLADEALNFSLSRKGLLLRIESEFKVLTRLHPDPAVQQQLDKFKELGSQIATLMISGKCKAEQFKTLKTQHANLERELIQHLSSFKRNITEVAPAQVLEKLSLEQSLVDFQVYKAYDFKSRRYGSEQVIAIVANHQHGIQLIKLGDLAPIDQAIQRYRKLVTTVQSHSLRQTAQELYERLWAPLPAFVHDSASVYLVPDGPLHLLPFKALQDKNEQYLGVKQNLLTLSSARDLVLAPDNAPSSNATIFAAPDFGKAEGSTTNKKSNRGIELSHIYFNDLPATLDEGKQIAALISQKQNAKPPRLFLHREANEAEVNAVHSPQILHLATHGFFLEDQKTDDKAQANSFISLGESHLPYRENPLVRSGLALADANLGIKGKQRLQATDNNDGILTALEVLNLDLQGTDLVTLSACETGVGDIKTGEGVYSLNRAFQEAGAKAVLSTLWKVKDQPTGIFMQKFYSRYLNGTPPQQALQATQQEFIQDPQYSLPYFWAGFVLTSKD
ncbi:MAG: tetratricopeptide repeat protein [Methylococcales bacterium]